MKRDTIIIEDKAVSVTGNDVWMTCLLYTSSQTATALHQLLSFGEAFRTVGHHATIIPVNEGYADWRLLRTEPVVTFWPRAQCTEGLPRCV